MAPALLGMIDHERGVVVVRQGERTLVMRPLAGVAHTENMTRELERTWRGAGCEGAVSAHVWAPSSLESEANLQNLNASKTQLETVLPDGVPPTLEGYFAAKAVMPAPEEHNPANLRKGDLRSKLLQRRTRRWGTVHAMCAG